MGIGESLEGQDNSDRAQSDRFKALVGAAFLTGGWPLAADLTHQLYWNLWPELPTEPPRNPRAELNEAVQARWQRNISKGDWSLEQEPSPVHLPIFKATVRLPDGSQHTGNTAEGFPGAAKTSAALAALEHIYGLAAIPVQETTVPSATGMKLMELNKQNEALMAEINEGEIRGVFTSSDYDAMIAMRCQLREHVRSANKERRACEGLEAGGTPNRLGEA
ncbi:unnamed protein product [Polarella glacialis]|uniref:Uncharacterized protein n=1 Tax=Polarella glacialis TaxID=89957 RepID=A0A813FAH9_POLGL|nr:unnamed protein product [Polarella glacialis]